MSDDLVRYSVSDRVALITVNDPNRRNAVTDEMSAPLRAAVEGAEADRDVHAVVITGAGKAFCAGADLSALGVAAEEGLLRIYDGFMAIANCVLPTIAAVNGAAVGAGMNLALAADVRIAGPHAMFDPCFQKLGIHPGGGATWMLQRGLGPQVARAALLFGMRFDADTAVAHGLALRKADDAVAAALELAAARRPRPARWSWPPRRACAPPPRPVPSTRICITTRCVSNWAPRRRRSSRRNSSDASRLPGNADLASTRSGSTRHRCSDLRRGRRGVCCTALIEQFWRPK
jgi:enoyl-CoA hydratase